MKQGIVHYHLYGHLELSKKALTYLLLILIVFIWGKIVHQVFFEGKSTEVESVYAIESGELSIRNDLVQRDSLILDYADPFLKRPRSARRAPSGVTRTKTYNGGAKTDERISDGASMKWPHIQYKGSILSKGTEEKKLGIVMVEQKSHLMAENEVNAGVEMVKLWADSVKLKFNEEEKVFVRR